MSGNIPMCKDNFIKELNFIKLVAVINDLNFFIVNNIYNKKISTYKVVIKHTFSLILTPAYTYTRNSDIKTYNLTKITCKHIFFT